MIKAENSPKIPGNFPKKPKISGKFPKNPKNLPPSLARRMGGPASPDRGGISQKIFHRGVFWLYPPCTPLDNT